MHKICIFLKRCKSLVFVKKKMKISILLFWDKMDQEKVFGEVLKRKETYLDYAQYYAQYTMHNVHDYVQYTLF